jgi:UDP-N-acetylmuramoyl-tripeptide--D-alanyl-D-alanine ligase
MAALAMLLFGLALAVLLAVRCNTLLVYFQQEEYDSNRFFTAWKEVRLYDVIASVVIVVFLILIAIAGNSAALVVVMSLLLLAIAWREHRYQYKKPLVNTERLQRIRAVSLCMLILLALVATVFMPLAVFVLQLVPVVIVGANLLLMPAQKRTNEGFINEAKQRLSENNAQRIGVTGSFGKTTVKHMLAEMLEVGGPVFYSKGSVNTVLGLTRHIRQRLQPAHRYFVAEMGAYQRGSIQRLCEFVQPGYGIVTAVGEAHAERFGGIETTAKAKAELAQWVCGQQGILVTSEDVMTHLPFSQLQQQHKDCFVVVGRNDDCDVQIVSSELREGKWHIRLRFAANETFDYTIPLLGNHNVMNSALAVALLHALDASLLSQLAPKMAELQQVTHRLELREVPGEAAILDDAYNSNEKGFNNAIEVLRQLADERGGRAVVVTPGIAELGDEHDEVHTRLGVRCAELCDVVVVVNPARINAFVSALSGAQATVIEVPSLQEAREKLSELALTTSDVVLYENDLPDILEEKRLL